VKLATWNINSIRARTERLYARLEARAPDVVCLQELKCLEEQVPVEEIKARGWTDIEILGQKTYNGVAILSRAHLTDVVRGFADGGDESQSRCIIATVNGVRVINVYCPNGQAVGTDKYEYKLAWFARLRSVVERELARHPRLVLTGDFNVAPEAIDVHDPAKWEGQIHFSIPEREALKRVVEVGLEDVLRRLHPGEQLFTWWDYRQLCFPKNKGLRIDHVFASPTLAASATSCVVDREWRKGKEPSDHAPVVAELGL
jgi:exodeoxyribonuclease-3